MPLSVCPVRTPFESLESRCLMAVVPPTALEQYFVELTNRARANPSAEAARTGTALNEGLPAGTISTSAKQPLAINPRLVDAARLHSQWMIDNDAFQHEGPGDNDPGDRMEDAGYVFTGSWTWGENLGWQGDTAGVEPVSTTGSIHDNLYVDEGISGRGHRVSMMNPDFREVGPGIVQGVMTQGDRNYQSVMASMDFAKSGSGVFLTGVAYTDAVTDDNFYTVGEGVGAATVTARRLSDGQTFTTTTWASGGYSLSLPAGNYAVTGTSPQLGGTITYGNVEVGSLNVKRDFVAGAATTFATVADGRLSVLGTAGDDRVGVSRKTDGSWVVERSGAFQTFAAGSDVRGIQIATGTGNDKVYIGANLPGTYVDLGEGNDFAQGGTARDNLLGGAGKDTLHGGFGDDRLNGAGGHDRVFGDEGKDRIFGGAGYDSLEGGAHLDRIWGESGLDSLFGQSGNDALYGRDDEADFLAGGSGTDSVLRDALDELASIENVLT